MDTNKMPTTPIVVFGYNRPEHLQKCLEAIENAYSKHNTPVYIFIDGPRGDEDYEANQEVISVADGFCDRMPIRLLISKENKGLANSIKHGIDFVLNHFESAIVVEDDIIVTENFLHFCNQGLQIFKDVTEVASIHGYCPPLKGELEGPFFLKGADCWGWATWKDRWESINWDSGELLSQIEKSGSTSEFNFDNTYDYVGLLKKQLNGTVDSWAIRWHASMFLQQRVTLYPPKSLVQNIGFDGSGTHTGVEHKYSTSLDTQFFELENLEVSESQKARELFKKFFLEKPSLQHRLLRKIQTALSRVKANMNL
jgi:glycosyltransferase involved in cell wall biosynthesis